MKRIYLCITPFFPSPKDWRGAYVLDQVKAIELNSDYKVIVLRPCGLCKVDESYIIDGISVHHVPSWFMPSYFFNGLGSGINGRNLIKRLYDLSIEIEQIAVAHCHTAAFACYASALKLRNRNIKTVIQYHDLDPYQVRLGKFATWYPNITYRFRKFTSQFKNIDLHLCISGKCKYNLKHFPNPHPDEYYESYKSALYAARHLSAPKSIKSYVLYNGVDTSTFYSRQGLKQQGIFKIGCIANFNELKDQMTLIRAVEMLVRDDMIPLQIKVSFIGSGETKEKCMSYIVQNNLMRYFDFEKEMPHELLNDYFNSLDLFVLPSYFEGFGCVYTEAAACGVPFIGCIDQGYSEYIFDEDIERWLIKPKDYRKLAELIRRQINNPIKQRLKYQYDIDSLVQAYLQFLKNI